MNKKLLFLINKRFTFGFSMVEVTGAIFIGCLLFLPLLQMLKTAKMYDEQAKRVVQGVLLCEEVLNWARFQSPRLLASPKFLKTLNHGSLLPMKCANNAILTYPPAITGFLERKVEILQIEGGRWIDVQVKVYAKNLFFGKTLCAQGRILVEGERGLP